MQTTDSPDIALVVFQHRDCYVETSLSRKDTGVFVVSNKMDKNGKFLGIYKVSPVQRVYEIFVEVALIIDQLIADARRIEDRPRYEQHDTQAWINIRRNVIKNGFDES